MRASSLSSNATMDILEDGKHRFFIGTESGGVCRILTEDILAEQLEFAHYNKQNGLNSDIALALKEMGSQLLIVGSNQIMTLDVDHDQFGFFDMNFFGRSCRFSEVRPLELPDGRWLFGLQDGAFTVGAGMMHKSNYVPPIVLTGIDKQGKGIEYTVSHLKTIRLLPHERSLTISFSALDYADPSSIAYAFKMESDEEWNYIGRNHSASFADLKPGTYQLQIRSTNSDGVWVDNVMTVEIIVEPTFLESALGRILITLLVLSIIAGIIYTYLYIRRIKQQQDETLKAYLALINSVEEKETNETFTDDKDQQQSEETAIEPHAPHLSADDESFMTRVMSYVESNISNEDANVIDMATAAATSKSGLNRKMKSLVGLTPADFLREARIKRACMLLTTTDISVSDIAYKCGFTDPKYFGKCFKSSIGKSPSDYRLQ
jgi:AraC-like DNA-binding protein